MGNADGPYHAIEIVALVDLANQLCATIDDNAARQSRNDTCPVSYLVNLTCCR
jgi:hypothetical protein